ncbi:MAG: hypothetical protein HUK22_02360, partial [Thermoguttaceae bacterium]|nr:hypothetical protein [Thermoguttaceae bacterium]
CNANFNTVIARLEARLKRSKESAQEYIDYMQSLNDRFEAAFPGKYEAARRTIQENIETMRAKLAESQK